MKKLILIIVVAIVGAGAWFYMGPYQVKLNQAAQKRTESDIRNTGAAMSSWLTDQVGQGSKGSVLAGYQENPNHKAGGALLVRADLTRRVLFATPPLGAPSPVMQGASYDLGLISRITAEELEKLLVPQYLTSLPKTDGWGHAYEYYLNVANPLAPQVMAIRSPGRDGIASGSVYSVAKFAPDNFDEDIVWADGFFVRWP